MKLRLQIKIFLTSLIFSLMIPVFVHAQENWDKYKNNPVLNPNQIPWAGQVVFPVVIFEDEVFKMWFTGMSGYCAIGYAESVDGINWVVDTLPVINPGNSGAWDEDRFPGCVVRVNDTLKMWYCGAEYLTENFLIGYGYYSEDSARWILNPEPVLDKGKTGSWDANSVLRPSVYYDDDLQKYHMWYSGWGVSEIAMIGHATSEDGIQWVKDTLNNPVLSPDTVRSFYDTWIWGPAVIKYADTLLMYFAGYDGDTVRIGYATSLDGVEWEVQNNDEPVLDVGDPGEWDDRWVRYSSVIIHECRLKMWFDGRGTERMIGYALGDSVCTNPGITEHKSDLISTVYPNPCKDNAVLRFTLHDSHFIRVNLYTSEGMKVRLLLSEELKPGRHRVGFNMSTLAPGLYFLGIHTSAGAVTEKIIKL